LGNSATPVIAQDFVDAFNSGDLEQVRALLAPNATWTLTGTLPMSGTYVGRDEIVDGFITSAGPLFGALHFELTNAFGDESQTVVEWKATGSAANGNEYDNEYVLVLGLNPEGQIDSVREYLDSAHFRSAVLGEGVEG
jgi:hypothetical protein